MIQIKTRRESTALAALAIIRRKEELYEII